MRLKGSTPDPDSSRELAAMEAALAGEPVAADLSELADLTHALRAERPVPSSRFASELDALVESGFRPTPETATAPVAAEQSPPIARPLSRLRSRPHRRPLSLALGSAASLFIVATALLSSGVLNGGGTNEAGRSEPAGPAARPGSALSAPESQRSKGGGAGGSAAPGEMAPSSAAGGDATVVPSPPVPRGRRIAPGVRDRVVERQAELALAARPEQVEDVADGVIRITDRHRGFVLSSTIASGEGTRAGATLDLRVPANRLQQALAELSELAHVRSRTQSAQDVTATAVSLRERLQDRLAERHGLLRQLARADTTNETASLRAHLRFANRRIAGLRASLERQRTRVDFAAVAVTVDADREASAGGDGRWAVGDALDDAVGILGTAIGVLLVSLALLVPAGLVALLALLVGRRAIRERRERALDRSGAFANSPRR